MKRFLLLVMTLLVAQLQLSAQTVKEVIQWTFAAEKTGDNTYNINATATIKQDWYLYSLDPGGDGTLVPVSMEFEKNPSLELVGKPFTKDEIITKTIEELGFDINIHYKKATFTQQVAVAGNTTVVGIVNYMTCSSITGLCLTPTTDTFRLELNDVVGTHAVTPNAGFLEYDDEGNVIMPNNAVACTSPATAVVSNEVSLHGDNLEQKSLTDIFIMGLFAGFIAFIMPCIYAMLPITVSFFTKRSKDRKTGIKNAVLYSFSIIFIFTAIGALISLLFGPKTMYELSSSMGFNLFIFALFVVFGLSLLGAFEITLPSSLSNKIDKKANTNSIGGIFFMALVLVVVSFSCTSAFIGNLIVYIISSGNQMGGIVGFFGFGLALALPFAIFALFPGLLNNVAKSGGWLNAVKVTMGFIELAMALKFLSNVDLQYHWGILNFDVYLCLWIVIFGCLSLYLFGKLRFSHDEDLPKNIFGKSYLTVTRLMFAILFSSFTIYLVPGLWGAPLNLVSGFLPERKTLEFNIHDDLSKIQTNTYVASTSAVKPVKYTNKLKSEFPGVETFFDYQEALEASKVMKKPIFVDFTGHSCVNCRKMERAVLSKPEILRRLKDEFIVVSLYCDDKTRLPIDEQRKSDYDGKMMKTIGDVNLDLQFTRFKSVSQPLYVFIDANQEVLTKPVGYDPDIQAFNKTLDDALAKYKALHP